MSRFIPGKIVKTFRTKEDREVVIRYPTWEDLDQMIVFINRLSQEDTYLTFSGETITKEGEMYYLGEIFKGMEQEDNIYLACFIKNVLVGSCTINRDLLGRKRSYHVGIFGITIAQEFRGVGVGEELAKTAIAEAEKKIPGLLMLVLTVYSPNSVAQRLYNKLGFREAGKILKSIWYRGEYVDEIKMYLHLKNHL